MMKGGIGGLMKQAQQMQENMKKMQEQLASVEVEGQSGAGMVKVIMTCKHDVRRVSIDPSVMDDREMLEDLLAAAVKRCRPPRRNDHAGKDGGLHVRPQPAARLQAPVLMPSVTIGMAPTRR
jgi:DNA-binding YbaB/EbfC family protein